MQQIFDYTEDYTNQYLELFADARAQSKQLGFRDSFVDETQSVSDEILCETNTVVTRLSSFLDRVLPLYWGNSCQALSTQFFAHLNAHGIAAEIVIGNVIINGTDEYDATLEDLIADYHEPDEHKPQALHAWVSLGGDAIVDAAIGPRLHKYYGAPPQFNDLMLICRAREMFSKYRLRYQPMLVGSDFFAKTNPPDPMEVLNKIRAIQAI